MDQTLGNVFARIEEEPVGFSSDSSLTSSEQFSSDCHQKGQQLERQNAFSQEQAFDTFPTHFALTKMKPKDTSSDSSLTNSEYLNGESPRVVVS